VQCIAFIHSCTRDATSKPLNYSMISLHHSLVIFCHSLTSLHQSLSIIHHSPPSCTLRPASIALCPRPHFGQPPSLCDQPGLHDRAWSMQQATNCSPFGLQTHATPQVPFLQPRTILRCSRFRRPSKRALAVRWDPWCSPTLRVSFHVPQPNFHIVHIHRYRGVVRCWSGEYGRRRNTSF
jgi:hypothetical protein